MCPYCSKEVKAYRNGKEVKTYRKYCNTACLQAHRVLGGRPWASSGYFTKLKEQHMQDKKNDN